MWGGVRGKGDNKGGVASAAPRVSGGAEGRDRTADTTIFSRMLYRLSYLGMLVDCTCFTQRWAIEGSNL